MNKSEAVACLYMQMTHISNDQFEKTWANSNDEPEYVDQDFMNEWGLLIEDLHKGLRSNFVEAETWVADNLDKKAMNVLYSKLDRAAILSNFLKQNQLKSIKEKWGITS
jgi:hypothetical protein